MAKNQSDWGGPLHNDKQFREVKSNATPNAFRDQRLTQPADQAAMDKLANAKPASPFAPTIQADAFLNNQTPHINPRHR